MRTRALTVMAIVVAGVLLLGFASTAQAAFKPFSVVVSTPFAFPATPATIPAGQTSTVEVTYTNLTGQQQLGSSDLVAPAGLTLTAATVAAPGTVSISSNTARLRNLSVPAGGSITATLTVRTAPSCTTANLTWPVPVTKQSNAFNGPPGNDLDFVAASSDLRTTVLGTACSLRFVAGPADAGTAMRITSAAFDEAGPPVSVEVVDGGGSRITTSSAPVTIAIAANPGSGTLGGTVTASASAGLATFSNPSIDRAGSGYTLLASSPGTTAATSSAFTIEDPTYGVVASNADGSTPATLPAGDQVQRRLTVTTLSGGRTLRSADIAVPAGLGVTAASVPGPATATVVGNVVQLRGLSVTRHASVTATLSLQVPCASGSLSWSTTAKSTSDYSGPADITLDGSATALPSAVTGSCSLNFSTQPSDAVAGQTITSTPFNTPSGSPVVVEVVGTSGQRVTWSTAPITVAVGDNPGGSTLSGTSTVAAVAGVASFSVSLDKPGAPYTLVASSPGMAPAGSSPFGISLTATRCTEDVNCSSSVLLSQTNAALGGRSGIDVTALEGPSPDTDAGFLTTSLNIGGPLDCSGYTELTSDVIAITYVGESRQKRVIETIDKKVMNATANNGAAGLEVCYGSPTRFATKPATALLTVNTAYVPGPYPAPEYKGLLPDCGKAAVSWDGSPVASAQPPCVVSRKKTGVGDAVIESLWPAAPTDPRGRS